MDRVARAHQRAEDAHLRAALLHERAELFWLKLGENDKAAIEHERAENARRGAATERRRQTDAEA